VRRCRLRTDSRGLGASVWIGVYAHAQGGNEKEVDRALKEGLSYFRGFSRVIKTVVADGYEEFMTRLVMA